MVLWEFHQIYNLAIGAVVDRDDHQMINFGVKRSRSHETKYIVKARVKIVKVMSSNVRVADNLMSKAYASCGSTCCRRSFLTWTFAIMRTATYMLAYLLPESDCHIGIILVNLSSTSIWPISPVWMTCTFIIFLHGTYIGQAMLMINSQRYRYYRVCYNWHCNNTDIV